MKNHISCSQTMLFLIWCVTVVTALVLYLKQKYSRFSKYGVKQLTPVPLLGNLTRVVFRFEHFTDNIFRNYMEFPDERFVGRYEFVNPMVVIKDIELIKKVAVKDFENFLDHRTLVDEETDPICGRNLFSLNGQEWKDMRSTLSPAFTSSKMRQMLPFMVEVGNQMIESLKNKFKQAKSTCAFGLKVDSFVEEKNYFYEMGKLISHVDLIQLLLSFALFNFPNIVKATRFALSKDVTTKFFKHLVMSTMSERESQQIIRPDIIHLLMEAKKGRLLNDEKTTNGETDDGFATVEETNAGKKNTDTVWSDDDLVAQTAIFFIAGFETVTSAMSFALHELATHPDVQEKLVAEIRETEKKNGGKLDYNSIQNMVYMDMVVSEVVRLWPSAIAMDRVCSKDYNLGKPNNKCEKDYIIPKGEGVLIPVWCVHRDPKFYPQPDKFDPERFSEENKHRIQPFTYIPFGLGPRNCIASRFALCEVKVMLYQLLQHMEISPSAKTMTPVRVAADIFHLTMKGGHWVSMKIRE